VQRRVSRPLVQSKVCCAKEPSLFVQRRVCCAKEPYNSKISCAKDGLVCTRALTLCAKEPSLLCKGGSVVQRSASKEPIKGARQTQVLLCKGGSCVHRSPEKVRSLVFDTVDEPYKSRALLQKSPTT